MFPETLERAVAPSKSLFEQGSYGLGGFGNGSGKGRVNYAPSVFEKRERHVGVFHERVARIPADFQYFFLPPGSRRAGHHGNAVEGVEGTPVEVLSGDVFHFLEGSENVFYVPDAYVAANGIHSFFLKGLYELGNGIRQNDGIRIHGDDVVVFGNFETEVESDRLSLVFFGYQPNVRIFFRHFHYPVSRFVRASIVYDQDFKLGILASQESYDRALNHFLFVIRRNQDGYRRLEIALGSVFSLVLAGTDDENAHEQHAENAKPRSDREDHSYGFPS